MGNGGCLRWWEGWPGDYRLVGAGGKPRGGVCLRLKNRGVGIVWYDVYHTMTLGEVGVCGVGKYRAKKWEL